MKSNDKSTHQIDLTILSSPKDSITGNTGCSTFTSESLLVDDYNGLFITDRIGAQNFRHRLSEPNYFSDWHMAGDATMIIIRAGTLRIGLRNGKFKDFSAGDIFIAKDCLQANESFDNKVHGHTAAVIGEQNLIAVHVKLAAV